MKSRINFIPIFGVILAVFFWGGNYPMSKLGLHTMSPSSFLFYRFFIATLGMGIIFLIRPTYWKKAAIGKGILLGIVLAIALFLDTSGVATVPASLASFLVTGVLVISMFFLESLIKKGSFGVKKVFPLMLCLGGLFLVSLGEGEALVFSKGIIYIALGGMVFAVYILVVERMNKPSELVTILGVQMACITLCIGLVASMSGGMSKIPTQASAWAAILFSALPGGILAFGLHTRYQKIIGATSTAAFMALEPIFSTIWAFFILNEKPNSRFGLGATLILAAVFWLQWLNRRVKPTIWRGALKKRKPNSGNPLE